MLSIASCAALGRDLADQVVFGGVPSAAAPGPLQATYCSPATPALHTRMGYGKEANFSEGPCIEPLKKGQFPQRA